jgi:hypothetical protein
MICSACSLLVIHGLYETSGVICHSRRFEPPDLIVREHQKDDVPDYPKLKRDLNEALTKDVDP